MEVCMFKKNRIYSHLTSKDLDILVLDTMHSDGDKVGLLVHWVSKKHGDILVFGDTLSTDEIFIESKDFKYWKEKVVMGSEDRRVFNQWLSECMQEGCDPDTEDKLARAWQTATNKERDRSEVLLEAVMFYASTNNWEGEFGGIIAIEDEENYQNKGLVGGKTARRALSKYKKV